MQLTEEELTALADLGVSEEKLEGLKQQLMQAEAMRTQAGPGMRNAGRVAVAANPMEHLATVLGRFKGGRQAGKVQGQIDTELGSVAQTRQEMMRRILSGQPMSSGGRAQQFQQQYAPPGRYSA